MLGSWLLNNATGYLTNRTRPKAEHTASAGERLLSGVQNLTVNGTVDTVLFQVVHDLMVSHILGGP